MQIRHGSMYYSSNRVKVLNVMAESERHHMRACFGPSDQLVLVLPNKPSSGQPATVEIHDAKMLEVQNEFECRSLFAGPLVTLDAPNYKLFYQCKKWMTGTQNIVEEDTDSFELIGNFLEHHIKQNGVIVRKNLTDLILKGHETTTTIQPNSDEEESDDRVNKIFAQGLEEIDQPFRVDRSIMSLKEVADHFRHLLMYGWKKDALDWAVKSKLWGHAFLLAHFMGRQAQAYVIGRFDSSDFEENDASQRFDEILNASPPATDDALDWAIQNNLWGHAFSLASKMDNKSEDHVMRRFANMKVAVDDTLHTFCQIMSRSDVSEMEQDRLITWRPHLAMILSNQAENSDRDRTFIRTMADALEFDGKVHACNFCYLMTEMSYGSSDNYKICLSASRNSIVLKLIDSVKNVVHIYSLVLDCQESIPTRHQELVTEVQTDQRNRHSSRLISGEDDLRELYEQQKSFILNKGIDSPELIQTCNGICKQILKENWNILDVKAYYIDNGSNSYKIMYGIICKDDSGSFNIQVKHVQWFLNSFEETKTVKFVPYSKVKMFSYRNRQHKSTIIHCIKNHCSELFKKHLNLKHISPSPFKEIKGEFTNEACIVMHILKKGLIPVGQSYLPRELEYLESECFPVDVRSTKYNFVYKADDFFQNLRMGCQVYSPIANGCFTLGGFVIGPNKNIFFVACAHSLLMEETVEEMVKHGKSVHEEDIESPEVCFQPEYKSKFRCGKLTKAVFKIGTDSEPGVDCALIQCFSERQPVCGYFPDSPGLFNILDLNSINNKKQYHASPCKKENIFTSGESLAQNQIPENSAVYKFGIRTGWTEGTLVSTFDSELNFSDFTFGVCMHGQFKVLGKDNWPFALEGDSGAWVFIRDRDGSFKAIGMVIGFEGNVTTVTPISAILDSLGLNKESIMSLPGSEDTDNFEDDDPSIKLHYEDEIKKVIPEPDIGFGITGFNMH